MLTTSVVCGQGAGGQDTVNQRLQAIKRPLSELTQAHQAMGAGLAEVTKAVKELEDDLKP